MGQRLTARALMEKLVSFPSVSRDSNLPLLDWVEDYLGSWGITAHRVYNADRTKANLYAQIGPDVPGGVVLSGHTDVVPVDGQDWLTDPWSVVEQDGRLYGRGTCDMKGFDALALSLVPLALEAGLKRPLQIALSYDEEVGCLGAPSMIAEMARLLPRASAVIVGEPSMMQAVSGHKGGTGFFVHVQGHEVHSSILHTGVNAIMQGAKLIDWANQQNAASAAGKPPALAAMFDPPYTTVHVGMISGGTAHNITAKDCRFGLDFRVVPGDDMAQWEARFQTRVAEVEAEMRAIHPATAIVLEKRFYVAPLRPEPDGPSEALVRRLTGDNGSHVVSYGTEAGQFQDGGYSAIVCGPGDIAQAHQPNEYITVAQFQAGEAFLHRLIKELAA